jgi:hypothetical protein
MKLATVAVALGLACGCASGEWRSKPAERPSSKMELGSRDVTVDSGANPDFSRAVAKAMSDAGFNVVSHAPYHKELELKVDLLQAPQGSVAVATLRSDGFFVDEVRAHGGGDEAAVALAKTLATSQAMADFVRNNGLPQQADFGPD